MIPVVMRWTYQGTPCTAHCYEQRDFDTFVREIMDDRVWGSEAYRHVIVEEESCPHGQNLNIG